MAQPKKAESEFKFEAVKPLNYIAEVNAVFKNGTFTTKDEQVATILRERYSFIVKEV